MITLEPMHRLMDPQSGSSQGIEDPTVVTETEEETEYAQPRMFRVLLHNDDYTTRDFVVEVLRSIFYLSESESIRVMMHVHNNGVGVAGVYTRELAETKIQLTTNLARQYDFPLQLTMEPEES